MTRFGIVVSRFNEEITEKLLQNCLQTLKTHGIKNSAVHVIRVPGGYEIPWAVQELARSGRYTVVIALGAVLKGQTPQNHHLARSLISHLHDISLATRVPCILGVITPNTYAQGLARTRGTMDRGKEAALAALEMARLRAELARG